MNIQTIVTDLINSGFSQNSLAGELTKRGVETSQPTIWRILNVPKFETGGSRTMALVTLHSEIIKSKDDDSGNSPAGEEINKKRKI